MKYHSYFQTMMILIIIL